MSHIRDLTISHPRDLTTSHPRDLTTSHPRDLATSHTRDLLHPGDEGVQNKRVSNIKKHTDDTDTTDDRRLYVIDVQ